jgi:hypothetical protein
LFCSFVVIILIVLLFQPLSSIIVVAGLLWWAHFPPLQTLDLLSDGPPLSVSDLPSFHHPSNQCSRGDAYRKGRRNRQYRVALDTLSRIIQEFFGSIAALFRGTPHYSHAILYQIGDRAGCTRSLVS